MNYTEILDIEFANCRLTESVEHALWLMGLDECCYVVATDSEMTHDFRKSKVLRNALNEAELILPDDNAVVLASKILGNPLARKINRIEFCSALLARMSEKGMSLFVMGSDVDTVESACLNILSRYPGIRMTGSDDGYFSNDQDLVDMINDRAPDLVLIGLDSPKQERWMQRNYRSINKGLLVGLGEGLSVFAGLKRRAPKRWRDSGFEWLYFAITKPGYINDMLKRLWIVFAAIERRIMGN